MMVIIDDNGEVIGWGDAELSAKQDALSFIRRNSLYLRELVDGMECGQAADDLEKLLSSGPGGDVFAIKKKDGKFYRAL